MNEISNATEPKIAYSECYVQPFVGFNLNQNKSDLEYLLEWIDLKTEKSDETATLIIEKITEMLKQKNIDTTNAPNTNEADIGFIPCYRLPFLSLFHADCMEIMKQYSDKYFDLAIVDPPYGIGIDGQKQSINMNNPKANRKEHKFKGWDNDIPTSEYFEELWRVSKNQIVWGANYFVEHINKGTKGWIVWYKGQEGLTMSDAELAYSSFNCATRVVKINRVELLKDGTIHPTQKPIKLYDWLLNRYAQPNDKILDTHLGSGSIAIAVDKANRLDKMNLHLTACEIDKEYIDKAIKRISESIKQGTLSF